MCEFNLSLKVSVWVFRCGGNVPFRTKKIYTFHYTLPKLTDSYFYLNVHKEIKNNKSQRALQTLLEIFSLYKAWQAEILNLIM